MPKQCNEITKKTDFFDFLKKKDISINNSKISLRPTDRQMLRQMMNEAVAEIRSDSCGRNLK